MAVPGKNGGIVFGSAGNQAINSASVFGISNANSIITSDLSIIDGALPNQELDVGTKTATNTKKIYSSAPIFYSAEKNGTFIFTRISNKIAGLTNDVLVGMAANDRLGVRGEFRRSIGSKNLSAWRTLNLSWTGRLANGTSKKSRKPWLNADKTAVASPGVYSSYMIDIDDKNNTDQPKDRSFIPGFVVMKVDFVNPSNDVYEYNS